MWFEHRLYDRKKRAEHTYKIARAHVKDGNANISAMSSKDYGERFVRYVESIASVCCDTILSPQSQHSADINPIQIV